MNLALTITKPLHVLSWIDCLRYLNIVLFKKFEDGGPLSMGEPYHNNVFLFIENSLKIVNVTHIQRLGEFRRSSLYKKLLEIPQS